MVSCQDDINLELDENKEGILVVEAFIRNSPTRQSIKLTRTSSYYDNEAEQMVSGAKISLAENNNSPIELTESLHPDSLGYYIKPAGITFNIGSAYTLTIIIDDEIYTSVSELKNVPNIDSMQIFYNDIQFLFASDFVPIAPSDTLYDIEISFLDNPGLGDAYLFKYYVNDTLKSVFPREFIFFDDELLNGRVIGPVQQFNKTKANYGNKITLEMLSISPELVQFYNILFNQTDLSGNLFASSPPANVPSNISNGAKGFFQMSQPIYQSLIFTPQYRPQ